MLHVPARANPMGVPHREGGEIALPGFDASGLPRNFIDRLVRDSQGGEDYGRITSVKEVQTRAPNSSYWGLCFASTCCCCQHGKLIRAGEIGVMEDHGNFEFLAPGYHTVSSFGTKFFDNADLKAVDKEQIYGNIGFVTISEAKVGLLMVGSAFKLLAPGTYQWTSSHVRFLSSTSMRERIIKLGPYTLVTVPVGQVAVTFNNGELFVLGHDVRPATNASINAVCAEDLGFPTREPIGAPRRTYFLENAKWQLEGFLPMVMQTDRLEGNDLLSKDNVEVIMVAMSQWRIVDPVKAVTNCATDMDAIRTKVDQLVRATIARIVASTHIGAGPVSGASSQPVVTAVAAEAAGRAKNDDEEEPDLAHLMKSETAAKHMAELAVQMEVMGIQVCGVFVPELRMKNDDIRSEVAKQAVIGIKAEAERSAADARAYATVKAAHAEAEAIHVLATAHADAGNRLGAPESTAARLALSETMSKAVGNANLTVFSGAPETLPFMFGAPPAGMRK